MKIININNFKEKLYYYQLKNGIEVYLLPTPHKKNYIGMFASKFGGKHASFKVNNKDYDIIPGSAHFLEHKLFDQEKGESVLNFYARSGSNVNARTGVDYTLYYFSGCNNFIKNLKFLINYVSNIYLTDESVEKEKGIIIEEIKMYQDNPDMVLYDKMKENIFINDDLRNKIGGEINDVLAITKKELEWLYDVFYQPSNMILLLAGNFKIKKIMAVIKEETEKIREKNLSFVINEKEEDDDVVKKYEEIKMEVANPKFAFNVKINRDLFPVTSTYELNYYLSLILNICFGKASKFRYEMQQKDMFSYLTTSVLYGKKHIVISIVGESNKKDEFLELLEKYLNDLPINKKDFQRIKKVWIASEVKMIDDIETTIDNVISDIIDYGEYKNNKINDIKKIKYNILEEIAKKINTKYSTIIVIKPRSNKEN